jgi:hypothetical protein
MINTSKKTLGAFVEDAQMKKQVQKCKGEKLEAINVEDNTKNGERGKICLLSSGIDPRDGGTARWTSWSDAEGLEAIGLCTYAVHRLLVVGPLGPPVGSP